MGLYWDSPRILVGMGGTMGIDGKFLLGLFGNENFLKKIWCFGAG